MTKSQLLDLVDTLRTDLASANDTIVFLRRELDALRAENDETQTTLNVAVEVLTPAREVVKSEVLSHRAWRIQWFAANGGRSAPKAEVDAAYAAYLSGAANEGKLEDRCNCGACGGTGRYVGSGVSGPCFRCEGKGIQTAADAKRNAYYDLYAARRAARS